MSTFDKGTERPWQLEADATKQQKCWKFPQFNYLSPIE